jgi:hypothetical protein
MPRRPQIAATIPRTRRAPIQADVEPPASRDAGGGGGMIAADVQGLPQMCRGCRRCAGVPQVCMPLALRESNSARPSPRAPPALPRAPPPPPGEAVAAPCRRACVPRPTCGPAPAWRALPRLSRPLVRAWRPRVAAQVRSEWEGKELRGWRRAMGAPGSLCLHLCRGARVAAASAGQHGAGDDGTRELMSSKHNRAVVRRVDLKKSTQVLGSVRCGLSRALTACCLWETARVSASVVTRMPDPFVFVVRTVEYLNIVITVFTLQSSVFRTQCSMAGGGCSDSTGDCRGVLAMVSQW